MRERVCLCVRADRNPYLGVLVVFMLLVMQDEKKKKCFLWVDRHGREHAARQKGTATFSCGRGT